MRVVDLFAGCGGMSSGFEKAGYEMRLAVELWESARAVYEKNFDHPVVGFDLSGVKEAVKLVRKERPDLIIGGPPCQDFSVAGKRIEGDKAELTIDFCEIVSEVQPRWFVLENVPGIRSSVAWEFGRAMLKVAGYGITEVVLDAAYFGVPQHRKRFFAIGCQGEADDFLTDQIDSSMSAEPMSLRDLVGDEFGIDYYYRHPRNWGRRGVFSIDEPSPTVRSTNRPVPPGYKAHPEDAGSHLTARPLAASERARVQTFNKGFKWSGTSTEQDLMIANAVPVKLATRIAQAIRRFDEESSMQVEPDFRNWLKIKQEFTPRTVSNVLSRLKRASKILSEEKISHNPANSIHALEAKQEFIELTPSVRSQIRRAIRLKTEFQNAKNAG